MLILVVTKYSNLITLDIYEWNPIKDMLHTF